MSDEQSSVSDLLEDNQYKYGFTTNIETEEFPKGITIQTIHEISKRKNEPEFSALINYLNTLNQKK